MTSSPTPTTALVTGATGNLGGAVVAALAARGVAVRAVVRSPDAPLPRGTQPVVGDLDHPESFADAIDGVGAAFLLPGFADMPGLVALLRDRGMARVVLLSGASAGDGDPGNAVSEYMRASEAAVREGGVPWTILRPNAFMSNALRWRPQLEAGDVVRLPFAGVAQAMTDPADIATVAAAAMLEDGHAGATYRLSGPEPLLPADCVAILAEVLDRPLTFEAVPDDVARTEMAATMPERYVDAFFRFYVDGTIDEAQVFDTVHEVTGRPPGSFAAWARAHAGAFDGAARA
jgi:uncharacterized protein YbjT (DUF2867 family)